MKWYVYKTTNNVNGMIYIGVHKSENIEKDIYIGSGKRMKSAIKKYGRDSFTREILFIFDTQEEAYKLEETIITQEFLDSGVSYNIALGGKGVRIDHPPFTKQHRERISKSKKGIPMKEETKRKISLANSGPNHPLFGKTGPEHPMYQKPLTEEHKKKISESLSGENSYMYGKHHSEESKQKMSESHKNHPNLEEKSKKHSERMSGEGNPFYGKRHSDEIMQIIREKNSGPNSPLFGKPVSEKRLEIYRKPVVVFDVMYKCIKDACDATNIKRRRLYDILHSDKYPNCYYVEKESQYAT